MEKWHERWKERIEECKRGEKSAREVEAKELEDLLKVQRLTIEQCIEEAPKVLNHNAEVLSFIDANEGEMKLQNYFHNGLWLFKRHPDGSWYTYRQATLKDIIHIINCILT